MILLLMMMTDAAVNHDWGCCWWWRVRLLLRMMTKAVADVDDWCCWGWTFTVLLLRWCLMLLKMMMNGSPNDDDKWYCWGWWWLRLLLMLMTDSAANHEWFSAKMHRINGLVFCVLLNSVISLTNFQGPRLPILDLYLIAWNSTSVCKALKDEIQLDWTVSLFAWNVRIGESTLFSAWT